METEELLQSAVTKIRVKNNQGASLPTSTESAPSDPHTHLFPLLEIFDRESLDPDINDKARFIYDFLTDEQGTARDKIMSILNELPPISNSPTIDRIWKYCRLKDEYRKTIKRAETLNQRMRGI